MGCAPQQRLKSAGPRDPCTCTCSDTSHLCAKVNMSGPGGYARGQSDLSLQACKRPSSGAHFKSNTVLLGYKARKCGMRQGRCRHLY